MVHPVREHIPIYLASIGPKNLELTGEIADGWLAVFFAPEFADDLLGRHRRRAGEGRQDARRLRRRPDRHRSSSATTWTRAAPTRSVRTPRCTSAAWAAASRTSTTRWPCAWATPTRPPTIQDLLPGPRLRRRRRGGACRVRRRHRAARPARPASPSGWPSFAAAGVTTLSISPYGEPLEDTIRYADRGARGPAVVRRRRMTLLQAIVLGHRPGAHRVPADLLDGAPAHRARRCSGWTSTTATSRPNDPGAAFTAVVQLGTTRRSSCTSGASSCT